MEHVIECNNLTHYYGKRLIYKDLNFNVPKGRILGLLGKNGTGKTTTVRAIIAMYEKQGLKVTVLEMSDGRRVDKVLVKRVEPEEKKET